MTKVNPFRYTSPVGPEDVIDREAEASQLTDRAIEGNNSRVVAPRRYGKTSLLSKVRSGLEGEGWASVYVDFFGVLTLADVAERIEQAYTRQLRGPLRTWFAGLRRVLPGLRVGGGVVPAAIDVNLANLEVALRERLAVPERIHARDGTRVLVVFDEFSEVLASDTNADATIRSVIQHQAEAASYIFAGSAVAMMNQLFADRRRAFYGQAGPVDLPPLPPDALAAYIARSFSETSKDPGEALDLLIGTAEGHPQRAMLLAHALWALTPPGGTADNTAFAQAFDDAVAEAGGELRAIWTGLGSGQRRALALIAQQAGPLYSTRQNVGGSRGGALRSSVEALIGSGEVVWDATKPTKHRVVDPLLAGWIRAGLPN